MINGEKSPNQLFKGLRIADFTWAWAGPISTKVFSDFGAEVIKIESVTHPDPERILGVYRGNTTGLNRTANFIPYNTGKLSITLNFNKPQGLELAKKIVSKSDIVIENFSGGTMQRKGLGYEELKKSKPDIIMISSSMLGQKGPYASLGGNGRHLTALAGINEITGWPDKPPVYLGVHTDHISPRFNVLAALAALEYRDRTGEGIYLDISQFEVTMQFMTPLILHYAANKEIASRTGNRSETFVPHNTYRCLGKERWCAIAVSSEHEWRVFCQITGHNEWINDTRFSSFQKRKENEAELDALINAWTSLHPPEEIVSLLQSVGIAAGIVQNDCDLMNSDPQLKFRKFYTEVNHPEIGVYHPLRPGVVLSKIPSNVKRAPLIGEHNEYVYKEIMGLSNEEISELVIYGIIE